jgi:hypothetical protein
MVGDNERDFRKFEKTTLQFSQAREAMAVDLRKIAIKRRRDVTDGE